ncbi:MAG: PepSY domain-containing protein [Deltaproteobacteria bacterium]|nr:PepSY domain-containing protein [Deltaproteobacteria bacterium]
MKRFVITVAFVLGTCNMTSAEAKQGIGLEETISIATKEFPGTVIEAEIEDGIYEIKIRTNNGEMVKLKIDPKDGSIIRKGKIVKGSSKGFSKP